MNLDDRIVIDRDLNGFPFVEVYPPSLYLKPMPSIGEELNKPVMIRLFNVFPRGLRTIEGIHRFEEILKTSINGNQNNLKEIKMTLRNERVRKELMREISDILRKEVRGLEGVVSIVNVEVSHDNSYAKVIYSVLGNPEQIEKDKAVIEKNTPRIRYEVGKRIRLRLTPELRFVFSDCLEQGSRVTELINKISRGEIK